MWSYRIPMFRSFFLGFLAVFSLQFPPHIGDDFAFLSVICIKQPLLALLAPDVCPELIHLQRSVVGLPWLAVNHEASDYLVDCVVAHCQYRADVADSHSSDEHPDNCREYFGLSSVLAALRSLYELLFVVFAEIILLVVIFFTIFLAMAVGTDDFDCFYHTYIKSNPCFFLAYFL